MLINTGTQERLIYEVTTGAGSTVREGSIRSDSILVTLYVNSITSGNLTVRIDTLTDNGKQVDIINFPTISAPTSELLLRKAAVSMQRFQVTTTYTGICDYEIYVRAVEGAGESSARITGSPQFRVSQTDIGTSPTVLISASLTDRNGLVVKNWSATANLYIAETSAKATTAEGYPLGPRDALALDVAAGVEIYAISDSGTIDVRIGEA